MSRFVDAALRRLTRSGLRRGIGGGGWPWLALAAAAYLLQRARRPDADAATVELRPGDRYLVRLVEPGAEAAAPGE